MIRSELEALNHVIYRQMCGMWAEYKAPLLKLLLKQSLPAADKPVRCWPNLLLIGNTVLVFIEQRCQNSFPKLPRD